MKFHSTRKDTPLFSIREAIEAGLAPDGGLLVPQKFPKISPSDFDGLDNIADIASVLLKPFFTDDPVLGAELPAICRKTFTFPIPLSAVKKHKGDYILELFHGPTAAFKDVGARFLAECMSTIAHAEKKSALHRVLVATSGDTGGAVAAAFFGKPNIEVIILYPKGKISPRQESQLCSWGGNVRAFAVQGTFDDCQKIAKEALAEGGNWLSANSINLGRILPQMVYYAQASLHFWNKKSPAPGFIIPSGNLGNSLACFWAKKIGLPIGPIVLALNANHSVADYLATGTYKPSATIATLANAMDVGNPSNLERLRNLYPAFDQLKSEVSAECVNDDQIREKIKKSEFEWGQVLCPHSATAAVVRSHMKDAGKNPWVLVATAHPAKFETIVEPLIGHELEIPHSLRSILNRPLHQKTIEPTYAALKSNLKGKTV